MKSKIKVGIIGTGSISQLHIGAYKKLEDVEVIAACDVNEKRVKRWLKHPKKLVNCLWLVLLDGSVKMPKC